MIITRTPLRISFVGGGSDIGWFYSQQPGAVVATTINKYIYITVNKKFDSKIRASYSKTEIVDRVEDLGHELIRESLKKVGLDGGIEITSISDIPARGTGLGSSGAYTVGLLKSLCAYQGKRVGVEKLAQEACQVEIEILNKPIGKQDQYLAAYGGFSYFQFNPDETVDVRPINCLAKTRLELEKSLLLLYTGLTRFSDKILKNQKKAFLGDGKKKEMMKDMVGLAQKMKRALEQNDLTSFGQFLRQNWLLKKQLARGITNHQIDNWYGRARKAGAIGGKLCGAGGGGFLLLFAPQKRHRQILAALPELRPMEFCFEARGSKIVYKD